MQKDFFKLDKGIVPSTNSGVTTLKNDGIPGKGASSFSGAADEMHSDTSGIRRGGIGNMNESFSGTEGDFVSTKRFSPRLNANIGFTQSRHTKNSNTIRVNYNSMCDLERFEKFNTFINAFTVTMPISKFFLYFLESVKNVVMCQISSIFVFKSDLLEN